MKCFSGSDQWSHEWQNQMNEKGHQASKKLIEEYGKYYDLVEMPHNQKGYDVIAIDWSIYIETKNRDRAEIVDITKPQAELSNVISVYDTNWKGYHCSTTKYLEYADTTSYYLKHQIGKYKRVSLPKFKKISTTDLREVLDPIIEICNPTSNLKSFFT